MDAKSITHALMMIAVAMAIGFAYAKITNVEDGAAGKKAVRAGLLVALSYAIVHYLTDGRRDAMMSEPFYKVNSA